MLGSVSLADLTLIVTGVGGKDGCWHCSLVYFCLKINLSGFYKNQKPGGGEISNHPTICNVLHCIALHCIALYRIALLFLYFMTFPLPSESQPREGTTTSRRER